MITPPRWLQDLQRLLPIRSQVALSGNIRDSFLMPMASGPGLVPLLRCLWEMLRSQGYQCALVYDPAEGLRAYPNELEFRERADRLFDLKLSAGPQLISLESLAGLMKKVSAERDCRCALIIDFASRIVRQSDHLGEAEHRFFVMAEKISLASAPVVPISLPGAPMFNPTIWLLNRPQDLPSWFTLDSERVASLTISKPDYEVRQAASVQLAPLFDGMSDAPALVREQFIKKLTEGTEGMTLTALSDITALATHQKLGFGAIDDAIRCYKIGALDNPWKKDYLREKVRSAQDFITDRVKGQLPAVVKSLDILKRSVMGLTGAQARVSGSRPRGVLFFAGPTGVGKTELAKTLTQLVFGNEGAYLRFDMSEFAEEHTSARLLGAPPGYIGFDAGGELTNAVREQPFSVILFDEIEKAHPRILDKFLQILEDGRLTDGRGDTTYFSESIIVFTSNLGIYVEDAQGNRTQNVRSGDAYEVVETRVRAAIGDYFKFRLSRPELLNRIGDNIVVFNFITPAVAELIFDGMLRNIETRLFDELKLTLQLSAGARQQLLARCTADLSNGGRGIGNELESALINPLSRALFDQSFEGKKTLLVTALREENKVVTLTLEAA